MHTLKRLKIIYILVILFFFILFLLSRNWVINRNKIEYGVTFSKKQAISLGLDWQKVFSASLDELNIKKLRLSAYWDETEPSQNNFSWSDLDWQLQEAEKRNVKVILAVGSRLPRWPECHIPSWANSLEKTQREDEVLKYIQETINRYKDTKSIVSWQVENEPFLIHFGECPEFDSDFLDKEISLVRSLDSRQIIITDSGELSLWVPAAKRADIFGTTMYRDTYSSTLRAYVHYPIEPGFFKFKKNLTRFFSSPAKMLVIELQAEPWCNMPFQNVSRPERDKTMSLDKFKDIIKFSRDTGFDEFYLWGIEWWYWEKQHENRPEFWNYAKTIFSPVIPHTP